MKKRLISMLVACVMAVSSVIPAVAAAPQGFTDVKQGDWFQPAVTSVVDKGLFVGVSDTEFAPSENMTRGMFVQVLSNFTKNYKAPKTDEIARFVDVKKTAWYYDAVQWAAINGIVSGRGWGKFDPNGKVTREEMVTMLFNYALKTGEKTEFAPDPLKGYVDQKAVTSWAEYPLRWAVSNKIIVGTDANTLMPATSSTRAQVAAMFDNAYTVMESRETIPLTIPNPADPDLDYLQLFLTKLGDCVEDVDSGVKHPESEIYAYSILKDFSNVTAYYLNNNKESFAYYIRTPMGNVFPELIGKTVGEVVGILGHTTEFSVSNTNTGTEISVSYWTECYNFIFYLDADTMKIKADTEVNIKVNINSDLTTANRVEISEDLIMPMEFKGKTIFTLPLPESYRKAVVMKDNSLYGESRLHFNEPISRLRYSYTPLHLTSLFTFFITPGRTTSIGMDYVRYFEMDGQVYSLYASIGDFYKGDYLWAFDYDPEVAESFSNMKHALVEIFDSIKLNDEIKWIN